MICGDSWCWGRPGFYICNIAHVNAFAIFHNGLNVVMLFCSSQIDEARRKVTITLNDCLACSGCVTSAETVLITQQSQHELYRVLSDIKKAEVVLVNLPVGAVAEYCDEYVCLSVCVCVCLPVCPRGYLQNHMRDLYQIFCACCLLPRLSPPPAFWWWASSPIGGKGVTGVHSVGEV